MDIDKVSYNLSLLKEDLIRIQWHEDCNIEAIYEWHTITYLTLILNSTTIVLDQSLDDFFYKSQVISDL